ncbi:MAG: hypothetical protein Q7R52_05230 [archaeon]|nr:hypothetical protein [archaeon]
MKSKRAAMEMSIGTIVTIVLLMTILIFGMIFIRNIMCSGIVLTDKISTSVENEIVNLFGTNDYGVKCMGEEGQNVKLGDGGSRQVFCIINANEQTEYELTVKNIESLAGTSNENVQKWIVDKDWKGTMAPGQKAVTVAVLDIPQKISDTQLKIEIEESNKNTGTTETHTSYVNIVHVSGLTSAVC